MRSGAAEAHAALPEIARSIPDLRRVVDGWHKEGATVGFVPTMGALHEGHLSLVRRAHGESTRVVASIFVNPIQFDRSEDLESYPRSEAADTEKLAAEGVDLVYLPRVEDMYPDGFATRVRVAGLSDCLCGALRPGHMEGVATVVSKLLLQVMADAAYFGEKDYQQYLVIRRMARDLDMPVRIRPVPTERDEDGLALSSRNQHLTPEERRTAPQLFRILAELARAAREGAAADEHAAAAVSRLLDAGFDKVDYVEVRREEDLGLLDRPGVPARAFGAAWLGGTRLIDNVPV